MKLVGGWKARTAKGQENEATWGMEVLGDNRAK